VVGPPDGSAGAVCAPDGSEATLGPGDVIGDLEHAAITAIPRMAGPEREIAR